MALPTANLLTASQSAREGNGTPLQYSCLETPMDGRAWWAAVRGVAKSRARLSDFPFTLNFRALEKEMATHSSVLAWRIPGTGESDGLPSMGSHRVRHDWSDLAAAANSFATLEQMFMLLFCLSNCLISPFILLFYFNMPTTYTPGNTMYWMVVGRRLAKEEFINIH